jgi:hypothetical protein
MRPAVFALLTVLGALGSAVAQGQSSRVRQFMLGIELLHSKQGLSDAQRSAYYLRLQELTGVTSGQAIAYINGYRDRPDAWQKLHEMLARTLEGLMPRPGPAVPPRTDTVATVKESRNP